MKDKVVVLKLDGEVFLFKSEPLTKEQRIDIECIAESMWDDYEDALRGLDTNELVDWIVNQVKLDTGIEFEHLGIDFEFSVERD